MKKCFKCGEIKDLSDFYKHKEMSDGYLGKCKECTKKDSRDNPKTNGKNEDSYDRTEKGVIRVIYKTQIKNSKTRNMEAPNYTKKELSKWLYSNNFSFFYNEWVNSNYNKNIKPSIDRLDDFKPYSFDNIRLGTWQDNKNHQYYDIANGTGTAGRRCKPLLQLDEFDNIVAEYVSYNQARRINNYAMEKIINTNKRDKRGFKWKYKD